MRTKFKHKKRGTLYAVLGVGKIQTSGCLPDMHDVVIYEGDDDGTLWARDTEEFHDGRFQEIGLTLLDYTRDAYRKLGQVEDLLNNAGTCEMDSTIRHLEKTQESLADIIKRIQGVKNDE